MVSFELTDEQREIKEWVHSFAEKEIRPVAAQYDESEEFPWPVVKKAAEVGLYGVDFLQQTYADTTGIMPALVAEELTWGCAGIALAIQGTGLPIAAVEPERGTRGQASFVVPPGTKGIRQGKKERKMGIRASHTAEVLLEDCTIPLENVLGGVEKLEGKLARAREGTHSRSSVALKTFELSRPIVGAQALGIARAAFEFALQYAKERKQFGRTLIENEAIAFMLADMATEIEATRALIWRALWEGRSGGEFKKAEGSMAKLKAGEVAVKVTEQAIQICGGYGYIRDFPVEKWHRDAKIYTLFEGTSEIQRLVISRALARD